MRKTLLVVLALTLTATFAFADREGEDDGLPLNPTCPVMEGEKVDPDLFVDYQGRRVWFCCESCVEDFRKNPEAYVAKLPQFAGAAPGAASPPPGAPEEAVGARARGEPEHPLGALHPIAVHFPIALIMVGAFAFALSFLLRGPFFRNAATFTILLAAATVVPAYLLGEQAEEARGKMSDALEGRVEKHGETALFAMIAQLAAGALTGLSVLVARSRPLRLLAFVVVLAAAGITGYTGYLGGEILRPDHLKHLLPF
jgi:uncharacterized membrane protein/YHS domain-containing protein